MGRKRKKQKSNPRPKTVERDAAETPIRTAMGDALRKAMQFARPGQGNLGGHRSTNPGGSPPIGDEGSEKERIRINPLPAPAPSGRRERAVSEKQVTPARGTPEKTPDLESKQTERRSNDANYLSVGKAGLSVNNNVQVATEGAELESEVVVGLDFGTATTKVIFRDHSQNRVYPIPIGQIVGHVDSFLVPTRIGIGNDGKFDYDGEATANNLKRMVMIAPAEIALETSSAEIAITWRHLAAGYLALTLQTARSWFLHENRDIYASRSIIWGLNLGVPSSSTNFGNQEPNFMRLARAAWLASVDRRGVSVNAVHDALQRADSDFAIGRQHSDYGNKAIHDDLINVIPEVCAEVYGYKMSGATNVTGMHLLVNVGASTLDTAVFNLHEAGEDGGLACFDDEVRMLGVYELHRYRVQELLKSLETQKKAIERFDASIDSTSLIQEASVYDELRESKSVESIDVAFEHNCASQIHGLMHTSRQKNPLSDGWEAGLPVLLCGGGSRVALYRRAIESVPAKLSRLGAFKFRVFPLPTEIMSDVPVDEHFIRLSVAYGLSFPRIDLGEIRQSDTIERFRFTPREDWRGRYVGNEMT